MKKYTLRISYTVDVEDDTNWSALRTAHLNVPMDGRNVEVKTVRIEQLPGRPDPIQPAPIALPDPASTAKAEDDGIPF
jgi:hypothetical protein